MILKIFSVLDSKAGFFGKPFFAQQDASAVRDFADAVNDGSNPNNLWHKHPEDFSLYYIGDYDDQNAELTPILPRSLVTASALRCLRNGETKIDTEELVQ